MYVKISRNLSLLVFFSCLASLCASVKAETGWVGSEWEIQPQPDIMSACRAVADVAFSPANWPYPQDGVKKDTVRFYSAYYQYFSPVQATCYMDVRNISNPAIFNLVGLFVNRRGTLCDAGKAFNPGTGACDVSTGESDRKQLGVPPFQSCDSNTFTGNPINYATGNKVQFEDDLKAPAGSPLGVRRYYNSKEGIWRHSYAERIFITSDTFALTREDGRQVYFSRSGNIATPELTESGSLVVFDNGNFYETTWTYTSSENEVFVFDYNGRLVSKTTPDGQRVTISRSGDVITLADDYGRTLTLMEYGLGQPLSVENQDVLITYTYSDKAQLVNVSVKHKSDGTTESRTYLYEVSTNPNLLTGIVDQRGVRFATWAYDAQGRAISTEHAGGALKKTIIYNSDGSVAVTNELGKTTAYQFDTVQGVKRVTSVVGQPSSNCPFSNSTFTYNDRGQVSTKVDAQGNVTAFTYNDRGFEISRTEANGTPLARTVTTEWDPSLPLPVKVVELTRTTLYTYDSKGRQLSQRVTAN